MYGEFMDTIRSTVQEYINIVLDYASPQFQPDDRAIVESAVDFCARENFYRLVDKQPKVLDNKYNIFMYSVTSTVLALKFIEPGSIADEVYTDLINCAKLPIIKAEDFVDKEWETIKRLDWKVCIGNRYFGAV